MKVEALKLALDALESCDFVYTFGNGGYQQFDRALVDKAITAIKQALAAQPAVQEPVGRVCFEGDEVVWTDEPPESGTLLYTTPPAPAVPDAIHHTDLSEHPQYIEGWNECRQAMMEMKP
jgi:hypothetical protein